MGTRTSKSEDIKASVHIRTKSSAIYAQASNPYQPILQPFDLQTLDMKIGLPS